jgi:hypothetical protein
MPRDIVLRITGWFLAGPPTYRQTAKLADIRQDALGGGLITATFAFIL